MYRDSSCNQFLLWCHRYCIRPQHQITLVYYFVLHSFSSQSCCHLNLVRLLLPVWVWHHSTLQFTAGLAQLKWALGQSIIEWEWNSNLFWLSNYNWLIRSNREGLHIKTILLSWWFGLQGTHRFIDRGSRIEPWRTPLRFMITNGNNITFEIWLWRSDDCTR